MAEQYQNVATPRFYVNILQFLQKRGYNFGVNVGGLSYNNPIFETIPSELHSFASSVTVKINLGGAMYPFNAKSFIAILGHLGGGRGFVYPNSTGSTELVNYSPTNIPKDGWSLAATTAASSLNEVEFTPSGGTFKCMSLIIGSYYDMPHSPDLNLTMSIEYDGIDKIETKGGSYLTNTRFNRQPAWGGLSAWEIDNDSSPLHGSLNHQLGRGGRRIWNLSFSYITASDLFPKIANVTGYSDESEGTYPGTNAMLDGNTNDFISQVLNRTDGGSLPFIFQPNNSSFDPDQFAICVIDSDSISIEQTAVNLYNIKLKIREVW